MGIGWSELKNGVTNAGFNGFLHWDNLVGTPTQNFTLTKDTAIILVKNTNNANFSLIGCNNPAGYFCGIFMNGPSRSADGGYNTGTLRNDAGNLRLQSAGAKGITITASTGDCTFDGLATFNNGITVSGTITGTVTNATNATYATGSSVPNGHMTTGSLTIGSGNIDYGSPYGQGWTTNTAGLIH
eukprot:764475-Hanusia_phi.AAC.1